MASQHRDSVPGGSEISIAELGGGRSFGRSGNRRLRGWVRGRPAGWCGRSRRGRLGPTSRRSGPARGHLSASLEECDAPAAVRAILALEETIQAWSHDTDQSDALARPGRRFGRRSSVWAKCRSGADPADLVRPFVDALLAERVRSPRARDWSTADSIRDRLLAAGIELHDTPDGTTCGAAPRPRPSADGARLPRVRPQAQFSVPPNESVPMRLLVDG